MQNETLNNLRKDINNIDEEIIKLLGKRKIVVLKIGDYKKKNNVAARDENRWQSLLEKLVKTGKTYDLSEQFITKLYSIIHEYFVDMQKKL